MTEMNENVMVEAEVVEDVTTNESTAIVPAADEYVPEAEPEKKGFNKAAAIAIGGGALALGVAAVKWGPQLAATFKAKHEARKNAKNALAAQVKAQEIYNNLNSVDDETLKKYYNERFSTPTPEPATTNDNKTQTPENNTENAAQTAQAQATTQPENKTEEPKQTQAEPNNKANNKKK